MRWRFIVIFGLTGAVVACGGDDEPVPEPQPEVQVPQTPPPAAPVADAPEPEPEREVVTGPLYTVQIGAFLNADSALVQRDRLADQGLPAWTVDEQVNGRSFRRVRVGAASTVSGALRVGEILTERYGWSFWVAPVQATEAVPEGTIVATDGLISG